MLLPLFKPEKMRLILLLAVLGWVQSRSEGQPCEADSSCGM